MDREKQFKRQNAWIEENRERQSITFPKGTKDKIKKKYPTESINGYVNRLVKKDLEQ